VEAEAIITQEARDVAAQMGIAIKRADRGAAPCWNGEAKTPPNLETALDQDSIVKIVERIVAEALPGASHHQGLAVERDSSGLRLVRGGSVVCEPFDTGHPGDKVWLKDLLSIKESPNMGSGFMAMEQASFDWTLKYDEIDYIIKGNLEFRLNGKTYSGEAGDVFYIPANTSVTFSAPGRVEFFYVTYPANWAEL
jgi:ethanolamine utilization protein EutQ